MAAADLSCVLPADAHPMANPGYGKRTAPHERPRTAQDFAHLPPREASIAALIDRLPDGAAVSGKALAQVHPLYGQAACLTALRRLSEAGHLRRTNEHAVRPDGSRWVTRTYFSRTARSDVWWADFLTGRLPEEQPSAPRPREEAVPEPSSPADAGDDDREPEPQPSPALVRPTTSRSSAYDALASLGRTEPRLTLSAADCAALEPMAAEWLTRDPSVPRFVHSLTAGLPPEVHSARGLLRTRLRAKLPPEAPVCPESAPASTALRLVECTTCRVPGRPEALPGGLCGPCRGEPRVDRPSPAIDVHARVAELRGAVRARPSERNTHDRAGRTAAGRGTM